MIQVCSVVNFVFLSLWCLCKHAMSLHTESELQSWITLTCEAFPHFLEVYCRTHDITPTYVEGSKPADFDVKRIETEIKSPALQTALKQLIADQLSSISSSRESLSQTELLVKLPVTYTREEILGADKRCVYQMNVLAAWNAARC